MSYDIFTRGEFLGAVGLGCCGLLAGREAVAGEPATGGAASPEIVKLRGEKQFIEGWLEDLLGAMREQLDLKTRVALVEACGRGCFRRHAFKQEMVDEAKGTIEGLIAAYEKRFEVWRAADGVHVRYGKMSKGCYCPVLRDRPNDPQALHCHCTKATHQTIFEKALGRTVPVDILETVRRGGKTCHFVARV